MHSTLKSLSPRQTPRTLFSSFDRRWNTLDASLVHIPRGRAQAPGTELHVLGLHVGPPVNADCCVGGMRMRGVQKPGDIGVIPAGMDGSWEDDADCQILRLRLRPSLLEEVADQMGRRSTKVELTPHFGLRDVRIEAIGWAIKADLEADIPSDPLYIDFLTNALAVRLVELASGYASPEERSSTPRLSARQLRILLDYIETNLDKKLHLADLASIVGVGTTRLKTLFRNSTGMPVHRYVIGRRIDYARVMLSTTKMPASQVALAAGFAHQSHMATTMRRVLGHAPSEISRP